MLYMKRFLLWCKESVSKARARTLYILAGVLLAFIMGIIFIIVTVTGSREEMVLYTPNPTETPVDITLIPVSVPDPTPPVPVDEPDENEPLEDEPEFAEPAVLGLLTGLPIYEGYLNRRPIAVVVNNIYAAHPQSGISYADVIYEVLAEGNITRFVALFQSEIPDKIGPVRSARNYFSPLAVNHDAVFVHHGGSNAGYNRINELGITNLDGIHLEGTVFWRDRFYPAWAGIVGQRPTEHSSYTGWPQISAHMEARGIRDYVNDNDNYSFHFGEIPEEIKPVGQAGRITVPFSQEYSRIFIYQPEYDIYLVHNARGTHIDAETDGGALVVSNILVQITQMRVIDNEGRRSVTQTGAGSGYLFTQGRQYSVRWERVTLSEPKRWYFECGLPVVLTPGKTWICIFGDTGRVLVE
jgi:hypothetical protein